MSSKIATIILVLLLFVLQGQLWLGKSSVFTVAELKSQIQMQTKMNQDVTEDNVRLTAEIANLKDGTAAVEQIARSTLDMAKPNEIFVEISPR